MPGWTSRAINCTHLCIEKLIPRQYECTNMCRENTIRKYVQKKRAEKLEETRARIAQAALDLHRSLGPARTTLSAVAERAGVQRHTLYAHFPDERSLFLACSGLHFEQDPPPDASRWTSVQDRRERVSLALGQIYSWYERNADLIAAVLRDSEHHEILREVSHQRLGPYFAAWRSALRSDDNLLEAIAMLELALSFHSWRTLAVDGKLGSGAVGLITALVCSNICYSQLPTAEVF